MKNLIITHIAKAALSLNLLLALPAAAERTYTPQPDLKAVGAIAALKVDGQASPVYAETYNLGATGLRGWIYMDSSNRDSGTHGLMTAKSGQILITVAEAPGSAVLAVDDLILGAMAASSGEVPKCRSSPAIAARHSA